MVGYRLDEFHKSLTCLHQFTYRKDAAMGHELGHASNGSRSPVDGVPNNQPEQE